MAGLEFWWKSCARSSLVAQWPRPDLWWGLHPVRGLQLAFVSSSVLDRERQQWLFRSIKVNLHPCSADGLMSPHAAFWSQLDLVCAASPEDKIFALAFPTSDFILTLRGWRNQPWISKSVKLREISQSVNFKSNSFLDLWILCKGDSSRNLG